MCDVIRRPWTTILKCTRYFPWKNVGNTGYKVSQNVHNYTHVVSSNVLFDEAVNLFLLKVFFFVYSPMITNPSVSLSEGGDFLESFRSPKKLNILLYQNNKNLTKTNKSTNNN